MRAAARALKAAGVKAVAVSFLYGFIRPEHEKRARRNPARGDARRLHLGRPRDRAGVPRVRAAVDGGAERLSRAGDGATTSERLSPRLRSARHRRRRRISRSPTAASSASPRRPTMPVRTVLSGPVDRRGRRPGDRPRWRASSDLITFDMGGTSTDVALLQDGRCKLAGEATVHGYPIKAPMLDIHTVGAGGGSIAYIDSGGLLKVGPRSAGADPGPVCYDHGNAEPTVTDANVVLQTLNPEHLLGGRMKIRRDLAEQAIARPGRPARARRDGDGAGHPLGRHRQHGARHPRHLGAARPRSARLHADGVRRRGAAARRAAGRASSRSAACWCRANPGILCAMGLLLTDLRADFARDAADAGDRGRDAPTSPRASPRWPSAPSAGSSRKASRRPTGASPAPSTCATTARTTS